MKHLFTLTLFTCSLVLLSSRSMAVPTQYHSAVQAANPLLWYQLNEASGNAINYGSLGAGFNATVNGTPNRQALTLTGDSGIGFDSSDDFLESLGASALTGNPTFSIETVLFLPTDGAASNYGPYLHWGDGGGSNGNPARTGKEVYFSTQHNNLNRGYAGFYNAGVRTASPFTLGEWMHVVWTRQGNNDSTLGSTLYINGQSVTVEQDPVLNPGFVTAGNIDVTSTAFRINRARDFLGSRFFTGTMDEIALYDRVLTPGEVQAHFNASVVPAPSALLTTLFGATPGMWILLRRRRRKGR